MAASRFASEEDAPPREFAPGEFRGRGRGPRGGSRGGRGSREGRGSYERNGGRDGNSQAKAAAQAAPSKEDVPALPAAAKVDIGAVNPKGSFNITSPLSPLGKWDEEVTAAEVRKEQQDKSRHQGQEAKS